MKQLKVGLTDEARRKLDLAAEKAGRSTSEEARLRLEASLDRDIFDRAALELSDDILGLADAVSRFDSTEQIPIKGWHNDARLFAALKAAVATWLWLIEPKKPQDASSSTVDPPTLGRSVALAQYRFLLERFKFERKMDELTQSLKDKPAFHWRTADASGEVTFGEIDDAKKGKRES